MQRAGQIALAIAELLVFLAVAALVMAMRIMH